MKDFMEIAAVILGIEVIDHVFGKAVGTAVRPMLRLFPKLEKGLVG